MPILWLVWGFVQRGFAALITFCSKPPGSWIACALAALLALWWFGQHEFNRGEAKCEAARAEAAANEVIRQKVVFIKVREQSDKRTDASEVIHQSNQKVIIHVKDQAAAMPGPSDECVPADIADGLRSLK
jgi:hypothetical protein